MQLSRVFTIFKLVVRIDLYYVMLYDLFHNEITVAPIKKKMYIKCSTLHALHDYDICMHNWWHLHAQISVASGS